ncbi:MAG: hypothetical protein U0Z74_00855 [Romboutsia timonensis]
MKIKGDTMYDIYQRELTMTISGIRIEEKPERIDKSEVKRVELHACYSNVIYGCRNFNKKINTTSC